MGMDSNYNKVVIRRIAKKNHENSRRRDFFAYITIVFSTALMFAFILYILGTKEENLRLAKEATQVSYKDITLLQAETLKNDTRIKWTGLSVIVGSAKVGNTRLKVSWQDEAFMEKNKISYNGNLPLAGNEIMVSQEYLERTGMPQAKPGDIIQLDLGDKVVRDYKLSAVLDIHSVAKNSQEIYVSLPCAIMLSGKDKEEVDAIANMEGALYMDKDTAYKKAAGIAASAEIQEDKIELSDTFFMHTEMSKLGKEDIITLVFVVLLVLISSGIVIYNIFYISITGKVQEYGQMRTMGMTKKQVKSLVIWEGMFIALKGIITGLFAGGIMGYVMIPGGFSIYNFFIAAFVCAFMEFIFVGLSVRKPGKIASEASPVAALGYTGYITAEIQEKKHIQHSLTPGYLAVLNLKRSKKKSAWTMCSLALAGVLLGTIASYLMSYDPAASVEYSFPGGEYKLSINEMSGFGNDTSLDGRMKMFALLQAENIMGEELQAEIESIEGVTKVQPWRWITVSTTLWGEERLAGLNGISKEDFELLKEMEYEGPDSYEELLKKPGLVVVNDYYEMLQKNPLSAGDMVPVIYYDGDGQKKKTELPVIAVVKTTSWSRKNKTKHMPISLSGSSFMMPDTVMDQWAGRNAIYGYEIATEEGLSKNVGIILQELYDMEENLYLDSKAENREYYEKEFFSEKIIYYTLAAFIVLFGIINLVDTVITNLYSRKKEFGILQAVGMSNGQLKKMINKEMLHYTSISVVCTLVFGSILGYALVMAYIQMGMDMLYSFPWIPILLYIVAIFAVQYILVYYGIKLLQKESIVERMKNERY